MKFHENCVRCTQIEKTFIEGHLTADEVIDLVQEHNPVVSMEDHIPSPYTLEEIKAMSGSNMAGTCKTKKDCGCD